MLTGYQVITGDGATSELFDDKSEAIEWANESNMYYEVIDVEKGRVVWRRRDQEYDGQPTEQEE